MITAINLISEIKRRFPSFEVDIEMIDELTIIGADLKSYFIENERNQVITDEAVKFINEVVESFHLDDSSGPFLDEIVLGLYTTSESTYNTLLKKLSERARKYFENGVRLWRRQLD